MRIAMYIFLLLAAGAACSCSTSGRLARRDAQALLSHTPRPLRAVAPLSLIHISAPTRH